MVSVGTRIRINAPGYSVCGVYEITRFDLDRCEGSLVGSDGQVVPNKPCKIIGYREPFAMPIYDPVDERRPGTRFSYCASDIEKLLRKGEVVVLKPGEEVGPIPASNRGAW